MYEPTLQIYLNYRDGGSSEEPGSCRGSYPFNISGCISPFGAISQITKQIFHFSIIDFLYVANLYNIDIALCTKSNYFIHVIN